jgi:hypothetical protein
MENEFPKMELPLHPALGAFFELGFAFKWCVGVNEDTAKGAVLSQA